MPLPTTFALQWYGPGMASCVDICTPSAFVDLKGVGRMSLTNTATPTSSLGLVATKTMSLVNITIPSANITMKGIGKMSIVNKIGDLTANDVEGAVLESKVEGDYTLKEAIRLLLSVALGKTDIVDLGGGAATVTFRDINDTKNRVVAIMAGSERTSVTKTVN